MPEIGGLGRNGRIEIEIDDIVEGATMKAEQDPVSKKVRRQIIEHKGELHPQIIIKDTNGDPLAMYPIPEKAYIEVEPGQKILAGSLIAKTPRAIAGTQDITGGLPRVTEIFEVRRPKNPSVISEIDGVVELAGGDLGAGLGGDGDLLRAADRSREHAGE